MRRSKVLNLTALLTAGLLCASSFPAWAEVGEAPDTDSYRFTTDDGHIYYLVVSDCTWSEALDRASEAGGYLVNIDGWTEYSNILHAILDANLKDIRFRIGACREEDSYEYHWVDEDGEPRGDTINTPDYWSWTRWITGGPSYYSEGLDEDVLEVFFYEPERRFVWNDVPDDLIASSDFFVGRAGYIVEFDPGSEGYEDADVSWPQLNGATYDEVNQSGLQVGGTYDEASQS